MGVIYVWKKIMGPQHQTFAKQTHTFDVCRILKELYSKWNISAILFGSSTVLP